MPQNKWDIYPKMMPPPMAAPYPLPGSGGIMPGPGMGLAPDPLSGAPMLGQAPVGPFDASYLSGAPMLGQFPGGSPDQAPPIGYPQPPLPGDQAGTLSDRRLAVQQAVTAIRDGADPRAVRARLSQVGTDNPDFDSSDPFSDLLPGGRQALGMMNQPGGPDQDILSAGQPMFARSSMSGPYDVSPGAREVDQQISGDQTPALGAGDDMSREANPGKASPNEDVKSLGSRPATRATTQSQIPTSTPWREGGAMTRQSVEQYADQGVRMYKVLRARGMTREQAAAWAANAAAESHGKFRLWQNQRGPGYGLYQWEAPRRKIFERVFGYPMEKSSEEDQLAFRDWEIANTYAGQARRIARASSAGDMAGAVARYYEGPAHVDQAALDRSNIAEAIMRRALLMPDVANSNTAPGSPVRQRPGIPFSGSGPVRY